MGSLRGGGAAGIWARPAPRSASPRSRSPASTERRGPLTPASQLRAAIGGLPCGCILHGMAPGDTSRPSSASLSAGRLAREAGWTRDRYGGGPIPGHMGALTLRLPALAKSVFTPA